MSNNLILMTSRLSPEALKRLRLYTQVSLLHRENLVNSKYRTFRSIQKRIKKVDDTVENGKIKEKLWEIERLRQLMVIGREVEKKEKERYDRYKKVIEGTDEFNETNQEYLRRAQWAELKPICSYFKF